MDCARCPGRYSAVPLRLRIQSFSRAQQDTVASPAPAKPGWLVKDR
jgi:hypothetical protein